MDMNPRIDELEADVAMGENTEMVPIHISPDEVVFFNILQGGQKVNEEYGIREYPYLSEILKEPQVRDIFITVSDIILSGKPIPEDIQELFDTPAPGEEKGFEPIESDYDPAFRDVEDTGQGKDKVMVLMPQDVVNFMDFIQGGERRDPQLGLQEFFLGGLSNAFKSGVRVLATVAGAYFGGPIGAGLGNMAGRALTGQKIGSDMAMAGLKNMGYAYAAGSGLNALGGNFGSLGANAGTGSSLFPGLSGGSNTTAPIVNGQTGLPHVMGQTAGNTAGNAAQSSMISNLFNSNSLLPMASLAGGFHLARKGEKEREAEERRRYEEDRAMLQKLQDQQRGIFDRPFRVESQRYPDLEYAYEYERRHPHETRYKKRYKNGGKVIGAEINGKGKGQDDFIPKTVKENSWVWDATTVGHMGDGATNAGQKAIESFEKWIKKEKLPNHKSGIEIKIKQKPLRDVPCALSNGERVTPPKLVAALGDGSFDKGASIMRKMTKSIRKHKISKGSELPPMAHDLHTYYKKAVHKE